MDPSYNNGFGSFGNGVVQQPPSVQPPSVQQPSNAQQDIILTPSSEKKTKKWSVVVILLLVGLGLTAGVVALVMWKGNVVGGGNAVEDFKELVSYIEDVPEDYDWSQLEKSENNGGEDWIYAILVADGEPKIRQNYYVELNKKYKNFLDKNGKEISAELLEEYENVLVILENAMDYQTKTEELLNEYEKDGLEGAERYIDDKTKCSTKSSALGATCRAEMEYYNLILQEHMNTEEMAKKNSSVYYKRFFGSSARKFISAEIKRMNLNILKELNA